MVAVKYAVQNFSNCSDTLRRPHPGVVRQYEAPKKRQAPENAHTHTHTYTHKRTRTRTHTHSHTHAHTCTRTCTRTHTHTNEHTHLHPYTHIQTHLRAHTHQTHTPNTRQTHTPNTQTINAQDFSHSLFTPDPSALTQSCLSPCTASLGPRTQMSQLSS